MTASGQDRCHRPRPAVRDDRPRQGGLVEVLRAVEPDRPRLCRDDHRLRPGDREGEGRAGRGDIHRPSRQGEARRQRRGRMGSPSSSTSRTSTSSPRSTDRLRPRRGIIAPAGSDGPLQSTNRRPISCCTLRNFAMTAPTITLEGICKSFPGVKALSDVALSLYPGEVTALIGENGAGKSTLVKILTGIYQPDAGEIRLGGRAGRLSPRRMPQRMPASPPSIRRRFFSTSSPSPRTSSSATRRAAVSA